MNNMKMYKTEQCKLTIPHEKIGRTVLLLSEKNKINRKLAEQIQKTLMFICVPYSDEGFLCSLSCEQMHNLLIGLSVKVVFFCQLQ